VIQWATGNVGRAAVEGIVAHPDLELVGAWVHSPDKAGRDVGEICGIEPLGVVATDDADEILAVEADCVVYAPILPVVDEVLRILESGKNVVTPTGWFHAARIPDVAALEVVCQRNGVSVHGTGINPGGVPDRFVLTLSALCRNVRHVRAEEFSDIRNYATEFVVREIMLFGKTPGEAANSVMPGLLGNGFGQSIAMVAEGLGVELDPDLRTTHDTAIATAPIDTPVGVLEPGTVAAQRFSWQGTVGGWPFMTVAVNWLMGDENLDPPWQLGSERFEITFDADPPVEMTLHGLHPPEVGRDLDRNPGIVATAMHCVNAIPYVCEAPPGMHTYLDLPVVTGRAAPELR